MPLVRVRTAILATLIGLMAVPSIVLIIHFGEMPLQPVRPAMARVVAIRGWEGRLRADRDTIVIRNAHGTGQFSMRDVEVRCKVGDQVPVEQQGVTLRRVAKTCR